MTLKQALDKARAALAAGGIEDTRLEAELLLRHVLNMDCVHLYLGLDHDMSQEEADAYWQLVKRRLTGDPTAYITGRREFFGLDFYVDRSVLIPRPESELLVERAIQMSQDGAISNVADIGTGCGAIAISLALKLPAVIYATDISATALEIARLNCQRHRVEDRVRLLLGDMLEPLPEPVDLIIANLPYVREAELAQDGLAGFEPSLALDGGPDGLDKIYKLCRQVSGKLHEQGSLLLEIGQGQAKPVVAFMRRFFPTAPIEVITDLGGIERVVGLHLNRAAILC